MPTIKLSDKLIDDAKITAKAMCRSVPMQIEYWAKLGKVCDENPNSSLQAIKEILMAKDEVAK
jgi:hypothetical protein